MIDVLGEAIRHDDGASDIGMDLQLSVESARSVRDAAIAIRYHGASYLPVVDDGRLVGIVAFREQPLPPHRDPDPGPDMRPGHGATTLGQGTDPPRPTTTGRRHRSDMPPPSPLRAPPPAQEFP